MQSNRDLILAAYAAFNRRDIDAVLALMHPAVEWPNAMEGTHVHGHAEVRDYWTRQWGQIDPHVEPVNIRDDESGNTIVEVHQVVHDLAGNLLVDQPVLHIFRIEDHLITRMDIHAPISEMGSDGLHGQQSFPPSPRT